MLGFPLLYFKGMRRMMFQLSGFYCIGTLEGFYKGSELHRDSTVSGFYQGS